MPSLNAGDGGKVAEIKGEFMDQVSALPHSQSRRRFLELMGASIALAGLEGCSTRQPAEVILPYARAPERLLPGKPQYYATSMEMAGSSLGLLVKSEMGRPIKIEGNPDHPASLGATDAFAQASLLGLYDPERSKVVRKLSTPATWEAFCLDLKSARLDWEQRKGAGLRILSGKISSPSLLASMNSLLARNPLARRHQWEPTDADQEAQGTEMVFGSRLRMIPNLQKAKVIVSVDADFIGSPLVGVRLGRDFSSGRKSESDEMNRLYVVEPSLSLTGASADHRLALLPDQISAWILLLAKELGILNPSPSSTPGEQIPDGSEKSKAWAKAVADDLSRNRGAGLILAGETQSPWVHALVQVINHRLGNIGVTTYFVDAESQDKTNAPDTLAALVADMQSGQVETLLILEGNPHYTCPVDLDFATAMKRVPNTIHWGAYEDETAAKCRWHIPAAHFLESWEDGRAYDGTISLVQPLIAPLYFAKTRSEMIAVLLGDTNALSHDILLKHWHTRKPEPGFHAFWSHSLELGVVEGTAYTSLKVNPIDGWEKNIVVPAPTGTHTSGELQAVFKPDATVWDGRFSNNAWLQELPKPITKLTWENAIQISPATASSLGLENEDEVELESGGRKIRGPIWIFPGQAEGCLTLAFGYGKTHGKLARGIGYNAYALRTAAMPWRLSNVRLRKTGVKRELACTQRQQSMQGRDLVKFATLEAWSHRLPIGGSPSTAQPSLYPPVAKAVYAWGMTIDLSLCTGCSACVIACQAENNITVVGKDQVIMGREMHWIRVDRYFQDVKGDIETFFQPLACVQCENAPCELVCPVEATVHSPEGLNEMIYNRCIGTRYCSNNCPYKVRRFNFFQYVGRGPERGESLKAMRNPDVTVRSRGVMEKCSYCVQRIERVRIGSEKENRSIRDGEVVTACQQVCPTDAIRFGNLNDSASRVAENTRSERNFSLLQELNTRPRTTYLTRLTNPNPALSTSASGENFAG